MKALVTGATGFLGRHLAETLISRGWEVTALGRNQTVGAELAASGMRFVQADLADEAAVVAACAGQDTVFHAGALSSPWGPYAAFHRANVLGTRHVIAGCRRHHVQRLIHVSTPSLYFTGSDRLNIRESEPLPPRFVNAYAQTKFLAENEIDRAFEQGLPVITIRPRGIFGPGDTAIMPRLIRAARRGVLPIFGSGDAQVDVTHVDNVVAALLQCQRAPAGALGGKYNITNGEPRAVLPFLQQVFAALGIPFQPLRIPLPLALTLAGCLETGARLWGGNEPVLTRYAVGLLGTSQTLDLTAARQQLGYEPTVSLEQGIERYARWWKAQQASVSS